MKTGASDWLWSLGYVSILFISLGLPTACSTATAGSSSLAVGDSWTVTESINRTAIGTGAYAGDCTMQETGQFTLTVTSLKGTIMILRSDYETSSDYTGHGAFLSTKQLCTSSKSINTATLTVDVANLKVVSVDPSSSNVNGLVGHTLWFMVDPKQFSTGSVLSSWVSPSNQYTDVQWTVTGAQVLQVKGQSIDAYGVTYSGQSSGNWKDISSNTWSNGPAMQTRLYDATYGIYIGGSSVGKFTYAASNGGWTETSSCRRQISDTNIKFSTVLTSTSHVTLTEYGTVTVEPTLVETLTDSSMMITAVGVVTVAVIAVMIFRKRSSVSCGKCGTKMHRGSAFCDKCGTALASSDRPVLATPTSDTR